jgi:hypothetical protein
VVGSSQKYGDFSMKWQQIPVSIQRPTPPPPKTSLTFFWLQIEAGPLDKLRPKAKASYHPSKEKGNLLEVALIKK